jgi:tetratricopeptide (TPR) repeat protein
VARSLRNTGCVYLEQGKYDEALEMYEEALAVYTRALGIDNHENGLMYHDMADAKLRSGDVAGAVEDAREAVRICAKHGIDNEHSRWAASVIRLHGGGA